MGISQLSALRAFTRLVELGSFTAVAEDLRVGQPSVSKWIAQLEDDLGVRLIDRTTRSQHVTEAGQRFYERTTHVLATFDDAVAEARQEDAILRGRIRMGLPVVLGRLFIVPLTTKFLRKHPELHLELVFGDRYVSLVEEGFDVSIRVGVPVDSTLRTHALVNGPRRVVASPGYLATHGTPAAPRDLERHECLVHTHAAARTIWDFEQGGKRQRVSVRGRISANNSEATLAMARSGLGISMLASWLVDPDIRAGRLVPLLENHTPPPAPIRALTPPGRHVPPTVRALIEHLREGLAARLRA